MSSTICGVTSSGSHGSGAYAPMPPVLGPVSPSPTRLKSCAGSSGTTVSPSTTQNSDTSGPSRNDSSSTGWPASSRPAACARAAIAVGRHHHALARGQTVVLDHPGRVAGGGPNRSSAASRRAGLSTISLVAVRTPAGGHHVLGERLRPLDAGGVLRRPEARDAGGAHGVGDAEHQRHLGADHHQVRAELRASATTASPEVMSTSCWSAIAAVPALPGRDRQARRPAGRGAAPAATHVHGHRIRSRGRARVPTLVPDHGTSAIHLTSQCMVDIHGD